MEICVHGTQMSPLLAQLQYNKSDVTKIPLDRCFVVISIQVYKFHNITSRQTLFREQKPIMGCMYGQTRVTLNAPFSDSGGIKKPQNLIVMHIV